MSHLLTDTIDARTWAEEAIEQYKGGVYGQLFPGVIWTDARAEDGSLLVEADPDLLLRTLARESMPLLNGHDPGRPIGHVLKAARFQGPQGQQFVAAILGCYSRDLIQTFDDLGLGNISAPIVSELSELPPNVEIEVACDPREVSGTWVDGIALDAPLPVIRTPLSHNASDVLQELIRFGLPYACLVWNPAVKAFGTELGKAAYAGLYNWLKRAIASASVYKAPLVCIESHQNNCQVSFLIRGNDVSVNYAAHEGLSQAAAQAARLIAVLEKRGTPASRLVYEFDAKALKWYPSYAVLDNKRIIVSSPELIAAALDLPAGLSLGLTRRDIGDSR